MKTISLAVLASAAVLALAACTETPGGKDPDNGGDTDINPEVYAGGVLGTTFNTSVAFLL